MHLTVLILWAMVGMTFAGPVELLQLSERRGVLTARQSTGECQNCNGVCQENQCCPAGDWQYEGQCCTVYDCGVSDPMLCTRRLL